MVAETCSVWEYAAQTQERVYFHHHSIGWHADADRYVQRGEPVPPGIRYQTVHQIASSFLEFVNAMEPEE